MNPRIQELLNVCGMPNEDLMEIYSDSNKSFYMQKFAELIVWECCHQFIELGRRPADLAALDVKKHFGVEP